jgi:soluble lytic murein transglycosylase-like protein
LTRICSITVLTAASAGALQAAGPARRSVVQADSRSGRLIRRVDVEPVAIEPQVVEPREVKARETGPDGDQSAQTTSSEAVRAGGSARTRSEIRAAIRDSAERHQVDPLLVESMVQVESNYDTSAVSHKGALGLMQLIPATARRYGVRNVFDARQNIEGGVKYLKYLLDLYGDSRLALAAYNAGEGAVARFGDVPPYAETRNYVYEVGRRYGQARREKAARVPEVPKPVFRQYQDSEGRVHIELR